MFTYDLPSKDDEDFWYYSDEEQLQRLKEQVALHRIRAHRILKGVKLEELKDAELMKNCTSEVLEDEGYYRHFEQDFEWYFDPEYCEHAGFQDYQRLVLRNHGDYLDWNYYHETLCTHEGDQEFIEFYENLSSKTKWIVNFLGVDRSEWRRDERLAFYHAVKNAASYPNIFKRLIYFGFQEYLWNIRFDNVRCKDIATLYFEIWKRVAKGKMDFVEAIEQVNDLAVCAPCRFETLLELDYKPGSGRLRENYETYLSGIDGEVEEDKAHSLIMEAVKIFVRKPKTYYDYAKNKLDIARENGIIPPKDSKSRNNSNGQ
ncbi:hypothetical protein QOZ80_5AG0380900 [Eleusine coracana subsp. coracana]|nr:hypothetical protein QOZ80_5AG0380900 [Eleusine coracana subsp. coracana]